MKKIPKKLNLKSLISSSALYLEVFSFFCVCMFVGFLVYSVANEYKRNGPFSLYSAHLSFPFHHPLLTRGDPFKIEFYFYMHTTVLRK